MRQSMTGYATASGDEGAWSWVWEMRSVNGRGLDLRLRVPDWIEGLEAALRPVLQKALVRGNVTLGLRLTRADEAGEGLDRATLERSIALIRQVEEAAAINGLPLAPMTAADVLALRGGQEAARAPEEIAALRAALVAQVETDLLPRFIAARAEEGAKLDTILRGQIDLIATLTAEAARQAEARRAETAETLRANLARVLETADGADPDRVAQELAMIAVKTDVTEEIDRLGAHAAAARELLDAEGPVGRKLDFLMQEFNREANTLCSKSQNATLTRTGLDLKTVIDQMREQVQNVE